MDTKSTISDEKLFAILLEQIMLLKTEVAINKIILESILPNILPGSYEKLLEVAKDKVQSLHEIHAKELTDLLEVESDQMTNLLSKLLSK